MNDSGHHYLSDLYQRTPVRELPADHRMVVFSDLHMGDGGRTDDFRPNAGMFAAALDRYYLRRGFTLILNGDIEELQRFRLSAIMRRWREVYTLFDGFAAQGRLHRIVGNHDLDLMNRRDHPFAVEEALRFTHQGHSIFVFHGHQTQLQFTRYNTLVGLGLRFVVNPLHIMNYSVAHDSVKRFRTEERVYEFSRLHRVMSVIGHTHRPLFESMSKIDSLKFEIERLCRKYPRSSARKRAAIERDIRAYRSELDHVQAHDGPSASIASLYNANLVVPCMFNSGTVVGKRGMTCLELVDGEVALVHWFDENRSRKYLQYTFYAAERLDDSAYHRVVVKRDSLDYVFARITLLAGDPPPLE